jgi:hypothetical protein
LEFCAGTLKLQLSSNININLKKGTIVTLSVPPQVTFIDRNSNPAWNEVTVEFFPATAIVKSIFFRGPGPKGWERNPCQEQPAASAIEPRPTIRK